MLLLRENKRLLSAGSESINNDARNLDRWIEYEVDNVILREVFSFYVTLEKQIWLRWAKHGRNCVCGVRTVIFIMFMAFSGFLP